QRVRANQARDSYEFVGGQAEGPGSQFIEEDLVPQPPVPTSCLTRQNRRLSETEDVRMNVIPAMQRRIGVSLDQRVLEELDEVRGAVPRSAWIQELVEMSLAAVRTKGAG